MNPRWCILLLTFAALGLASGCEHEQIELIVTTTLDTVDAVPGDGVCEATPGDGDCSLRAAIQEANTLDGHVTIVLVPGATYPLSLAGVGEDAGATGDLDVTGRLTVQGGGATVDASGIDRVFEIRPGGDAGFEALTVTGGSAEHGGGLYVGEGATVALGNSTVTGNLATGRHGYAYSLFFPTSNGPVEGRGGGGGIDNDGTLTMWSSTISDNTIAAEAGCFSPPPFHGSVCYYHAGGGLLNNGTADLANVTVSGNTAQEGIGAAVAELGDASTTLLHATIADNSVDATGYGADGGPFPMATHGRALVGSLVLGGTVVAGDGALCSEPLSPLSLGYNLAEDDTCFTGAEVATDTGGTPAGLSSLADFGGPTRTHLPGSALIDAIPSDPAGCDLLPDQRGEQRPAGAGCDIGAVERQGADAAPLALVTTALPGAPGGEAYAATIVAAQGVPPYSWSLTGALPSGLVWDPASATISGTPVETGEFPLTVTVTDGSGSDQTRDLTISVPPLVLGTSSVPSGRVGQTYIATLDGTGGVQPLTWEIDGPLPQGLVFSPELGRVSGVPTESGAFPLTIRLVDASPTAIELVTVLTVHPPLPLAITSDPADPSEGFVGYLYRADFTATGGVPPTTWSLDGALPPGLTWDPVLGVIEGTPTATGSFPVTVSAIDSVSTTTERELTIVVSEAVPYAAVDTGSRHTCGIVVGGTVRCWGANGDGQLGDGTFVRKNTPVDVVGLTDVVGIAAGGGFSCALRSDQTVRCWGANGAGQLGNGTTTRSTVPVVVTGLSGVTAIDAGLAHACATLVDGTVRCWGSGRNGRLGNGTETDSTVPVAVVDLAGAIDLAVSDVHSCAVVAGGTVSCWGRNSNGQLGDGTTTQQLTPVTVLGLADATAVSAGTRSTCARRFDGALMCWGDNSHGELGDGTTTPSSTPVAVTVIAQAVSVVLGDDHACALLEDQTASCWGGNTSGQLGNGGVGASGLPVDGLDDAIAISSTLNHTCALTASAEIWCWGANFDGQLGDGTFDSATSPVRVSA